MPRIATMVAALAEEQELPSGTDRDKIGQKIQDFVEVHEEPLAVWQQPFLTGRDYLPR